MKQQIKATVIIPTHNHGELIKYPIESVLAQSLSDFELFIIGDGAPPITKEIVETYQRQDPRIRYFEFPKGQRNGEAYRHKIITDEAQGDIICYLGDDDIWLPNHLQAMAVALIDADMAHSIHTYFPMNSEELITLIADLNKEYYRNLLRSGENRFGLSFFAHRKDAYAKLPYGWRTTPDGIWTDLYMYQQFLSQDWLRAVTVNQITAVHFPSSLRRNCSAHERMVELKKWHDISKKIQHDNIIYTSIISANSRRLVDLELENAHFRQYATAQEMQLSQELAAHASTKEKIQAMAEELLRYETELAHIYQSKSWKLARIIQRLYQKIFS